MKIAYISIMRNLLIILFGTIFLTDVVAVSYAASQPITLKDVDGIKIERQATSATNYSYFVFTNQNDYPVTINYSVTGHIPCTISLQKGESKRSHSAYINDCNIKMSVQKDADTTKSHNKKRHKKSPEKPTSI